MVWCGVCVCVCVFGGDDGGMGQGGRVNCCKAKTSRLRCVRGIELGVN